jgi:hypothetical protein
VALRFAHVSRISARAAALARLGRSHLPSRLCPLRFSSKLSQEDSGFEALDVFALASAVAHDLGLKPSEASSEEGDQYNAWGKHLTDQAERRRDALKTFDTILIDESQGSRNRRRSRLHQRIAASRSREERGTQMSKVQEGSF